MPPQTNIYMTEISGMPQPNVAQNEITEDTSIKNAFAYSHMPEEVQQVDARATPPEMQEDLQNSVALNNAPTAQTAQAKI